MAEFGVNVASMMKKKTGHPSEPSQRMPADGNTDSRSYAKREVNDSTAGTIAL
jgi:hypothetical protein